MGELLVFEFLVPGAGRALVGVVGKRGQINDEKTLGFLGGSTNW